MKSILKKIISKFLPANYLQRRAFMRRGFDAEIWGGGIFREHLNEAFSKFLQEDEKNNKKNLTRLTNDIVDCYLLYGASPEEYFLYDLRHASSQKRASFVTDMDKDKVCMSVVGLDKFQKELCDKFFFYQTMENFFKREAIVVKGEQDREKFLHLAQKTSQLFAKPLEGSWGRGAQKIMIRTEGEAHEAFRKLLHDGGEWIIEEQIIQTEEMAAWNRDSVNSVRIPSFLIENKSVVLSPYFRTGRKGAVVDNGMGGGIMACIDLNSGIVNSDGVDGNNTNYTHHPDSGLMYRGFQVPEWGALLHMVNEAHRTMPGHRYIAFDCALTHHGWVLIEGNWGQFGSQWINKKGIKEEFHRYMGVE